MRRNSDAGLRHLEREYLRTRSLELARRVAEERRRLGFPSVEDALAALFSNAGALGARLPGGDAREFQREPQEGQRARVWRFFLSPGNHEYVMQRHDVPDFAEGIEQRTILVRRMSGRRITEFVDVTDDQVYDRAVPQPTASFIAETTRFMLWELLIRPTLNPPPFDLRRLVFAPTLSNGLMAWASGTDTVWATDIHTVGILLRDADAGRSSRDADPRLIRLANNLYVRPFTLVVRDRQMNSLTIGVRFSEFLPNEPASVWTHLRDEAAEDVAIDEQVYLDWARSDRDDRVVVHEADAVVFATGIPL